MQVEAINRVANAALHLNELADALENVPDMVKEANEMSAACAMFLSLKENYAALDDARKRIYKVVDLINKGVLPEKFETAGVDKVQVPELKKSFYPTQKHSASFIDKDKGFEWLRELGQGDAITETVNASTLSALVKSMILEDGIDPPEDVVKFNTYYIMGVSKYTPKETI